MSQGVEQLEADIIAVSAETVQHDDGIIDNMNEAMQDLNMNEKEYSESETEEILTFFKTCVVSKEKSALIEKLSQTINLRCEMLKANNRDIREIFPFFFVAPDLVSQDYHITNITYVQIIIKNLHFRFWKILD